MEEGREGAGWPSSTEYKVRLHRKRAPEQTG